MACGKQPNLENQGRTTDLQIGDGSARLQYNNYYIFDTHTKNAATTCRKRNLSPWCEVSAHWHPHRLSAKNLRHAQRFYSYLYTRCSSPLHHHQAICPWKTSCFLDPGRQVSGMIFRKVCSGNFCWWNEEGKNPSLLVERKWSCSLWDGWNHANADWCTNFYYSFYSATLTLTVFLYLTGHPSRKHRGQWRRIC